MIIFLFSRFVRDQSGLDKSEFKVALKNGDADGAVHLTSSLVLLRLEVVVSGRHVVVYLDAVNHHTLFIDGESLGVDEGVAYVLELCDAIGANLVTALHGGGDLGVEITELEDGRGHLVGGAFLKVIHGGSDVSDEGVDILDACLKAINVLNLEGPNEDTVNQLSHIRSRHHAKRATHIIATQTPWIRGQFTAAICRIKLCKGCSRNKS